MVQDRQTPGQVVGALAAGVAPVPLLMIYSVLFLAHGLIVDVETPDVTGSRTGEAIVGVLCLGLLAVVVLSLYWFLEAVRRWPFLYLQAAALVVSCVFVFDSDFGDPQVPAVLAVLALVALVLGLHPASWEWMGRRVPLRRDAATVGAGAHDDSDDQSVT